MNIDKCLACKQPHADVEVRDGNQGRYYTCPNRGVMVYLFRTDQPDLMGLVGDAKPAEVIPGRPDTMGLMMVSDDRDKLDDLAKRVREFIDKPRGEPIPLPTKTVNLTRLAERIYRLCRFAAMGDTPRVPDGEDGAEFVRVKAEFLGMGDGAEDAILKAGSWAVERVLAELFQGTVTPVIHRTRPEVTIADPPQVTSGTRTRGPFWVSIDCSPLLWGSKPQYLVVEGPRDDMPMPQAIQAWSGGPDGALATAKEMNERAKAGGVQSAVKLTWPGPHGPILRVNFADGTYVDVDHDYTDRVGGLIRQWGLATGLPSRTRLCEDCWELKPWSHVHE